MIKEKVVYVNEEDWCCELPKDEDGEANTSDLYFPILTIGDLKEVINSFNLVKKIKKGIIFGGDEKEITISKTDLDEITDFFDEVDKFEELKKEVRNSSQP